MKSHELEISALATEEIQQGESSQREELIVKLQCVNFENLVLLEKSHQN